MIYAQKEGTMPIRIQSDLPAREILDRENIFVMDEEHADLQDIRPLEVLILNLMPLKEDTELQLLRSLSNTPLQINITFLMMDTHESKNASTSHLNKFYQVFRDIKRKCGCPEDQKDQTHHVPPLLLEDLQPALDLRAQVRILFKIAEKRLDVAGRKDHGLAICSDLLGRHVEERLQVVVVELLYAYNVDLVILHFLAVKLALKELMLGLGIDDVHAF
jgi:hypothetical protein